MTVDIQALNLKVCLHGDGLDEGLSVAVCSCSVHASNGSQFSRACLTAGEGISTPNPSLAMEEPLFVQDLSGVSSIWEGTLFPGQTKCLLSPVPTESVQRLLQSGCFMDCLLSPFTVLIKLYILEVKMSFLVILVRKALQHLQAESRGEASDQRQAVMSYQRQAQGQWGQKGHCHSGS